MHSVTCSDPFDCFGVECVRITLVGQSFMIHQIRKMIGLAIVVCYYGLSSKVIQYAFAAEKMTMMMVPGEFLTLDHPVFDDYNKKVFRMKQAAFRTIEISKMPGREEFRQNQIYKQMMEKEKKKHLMREFVNRIPSFRAMVNGQYADWFGWIRRAENIETIKSNVNSITPTTNSTTNSDFRVEFEDEGDKKQMMENQKNQPTNEEENEEGGDE